MNFVTSRLGQYLFRRTLSGIGVAFSAVLASIILIDLVEQMRTLGTRTELSLIDALKLTLMKTPMLIEQTLPFIVLAGAMMATIGLNRSSELVAVRASGVSAWRFLSPAAVLGLVLGVVTITLINPLGAAYYRQFENARSTLRDESGGSASPNGIWIRQGDGDNQVVIHAASVDEVGSRLEDATFFIFDVRSDALRFVRRIRAAQAELKPGFWQLSDVDEAAPAQPPLHHDAITLPSQIGVNELVDRLITPATLSFWRLPGFIAEARAAGFAPTRYELKFHNLIAYPVLLAAMAMLGAVFSLRLQRLGGLARWGAMGVALGLLLFFYSQLAGAFAITQSAPAIVAAWSAPIAGLCIALAMVAFTEDG